MRPLALGLLFLLGGCSQPPPDRGAAPTAWTGALDERAFAALHDLKQEPAPPALGTMVDLDGQRHYLSLPPQGRPPFPAVLVIHEWWGLNEHIKHWSDRLAADGYAALAVDLYGGKVATDRDQAMAAMRAVEAAEATATLQAAHAFLRSDARVAAPKRGCIGWCFGGAWSLRHAIATPDLDACVLYYGSLVEDPEQLRRIAAPVLAVFGNRDRSITPAAVDRFEAAMEAAGRDLEVLRFDADHAFANPSGGRYDQQSAASAWAVARQFLARQLR